MPQTKADKIFFEFTGGINTEVSPLTFPDGVSLDEENFELMPDGTRKRRRGLSLETGGAALDISDQSLPAGAAFSYHRWGNVAGDPALKYIAVQLGGRLYFFEDTDTVSPNQVGSYIDLTGFGTTASDTDVTNVPCTFADGLGLLFIAGPHMEPHVIEWDTDASEFVATQVDIRVRDFKGIDDGIPVIVQPTTLTDDHRYNLINRGWLQDNIDQYFTDTGAYPAKNQVPWLGYRRLIDLAYAEADGNKEWSSAKLEAEVFGASSSPQGSLFLDPFNTANSATDSVQGDLPIITWTVADELSEIWSVTVEATAHGLSVSDDMTISGNQFRFGTDSGGIAVNSLNGTRTVTVVPDTDHFTFNYVSNPNWNNWLNQYLSLGYVVETPIVKSDGFVSDARPAAVAWHAGRAFWAGVAHSEYNDTIFFSQIVTKARHVGICGQENDPTAEHLNSTLPSDGGTIQIPGMGGVIRMVPFGSALYVFCTLGVWEIGPGQEGFFNATGYSVRKVTDVEATAVLGVVQGDFGVVFTSPRGIFVLTQDSNSGFVVAQSLSESRVQTLWNDIHPDKQAKVQCLYDSALKRYYIFYSTDSASAAFSYDKALVFDVVRGAFYKLGFPSSSTTHIFGVLTTSASDSTDENKKLKVLVQTDSFAEVEICDMDHDDFLDFDGTEQIPYLLTGYDNVGDFQRRRQAPVCHVFLKKTETGYTEVGDDLVPTNESSVFLEARWDWADSSITGKFSTPQQVYRHTRAYTPSSSSDGFDDGYPVVVTRNKIRGRGRALHLKFYGEEGFDAHLLGWALQYAGTQRV